MLKTTVWRGICCVALLLGLISTTCAPTPDGGGGGDNGGMDGGGDDGNAPQPDTDPFPGSEDVPALLVAPNVASSPLKNSINP